jgi:7-cyano-7-deazaguanine synthase in queuosine biosynthesis
MRQVAVFDYNQRAAAEEKLARLLAAKKGIHFLQIVKEPMPEPAPAGMLPAE